MASTAMNDFNGKKMLKSDQGQICNLPDAVLHHILSLLDMKEVVATSLLSTRWRHVWVSLPVLNFNEHMWKTELKDSAYAGSEGFMNFVDKVLFFRDNSVINKFRITCSSYCDSDRIDAWLTAAARRKFREIHFEMVVEELKRLPNLLFSSSITVLKIDSDSSSMNGALQIPNLICSSPILKTLSLSDVKLPEGNSDGALVFSNPALENLTLENCEQTHLNVLNISTYCLKNLVIHNDFTNSCQLKICTPNLASIELRGSWYEDFHLENISSLVSAEFELCVTEAQHVIKAFGCVSCPTTVELSVCFLTYEELPEKLTRPFTNIRCLLFNIYGVPKSMMGSNRYLWKLLSFCPCLETLYLDTYDIEDREEQCPFPVTFHHLKYVEVGTVKTCQGELGFLKCLLKNAIVLEKLVIANTTSLSDLKTKHEFGDRIHSLPRISPKLTVVLLN